MSSNRTAKRTAAPPVIISPHPKPVISVEEWESKAPLGDVETRSVAAIKAASEHLPLPLKFRNENSGPSRPSTPRISRPTTPIPLSPGRLATGSHALHPQQPVQTPQQFYDWFALIDRSVAHSQEAHFRAYISGVTEHLDVCNFLLDRVDEIDREVNSMLDGWRSVEAGGRSLKDACEVLLKERDELLDLTDNIGEHLEYFHELEHATRMLNHPGESLVLQTEFLYMVERVDICIDFLRAHRHYKEADVYLLRFQQCMTRAMTLIKMFFVGSLRALYVDISRRLSEKDVSSTAQMHLLYTRFKSVSPQLAPLLGELERRAKAHPDELSALLSECHVAYFSTRKSLVVGRVIEEIKGLDPARTELVELTRAGCSYLKQLCTEEFALYRDFFNSGENQLYQYLENLCDYLYDDLRPRILHEQRLTALCEVCTVLQALMVLDVASIDDSTSEDEDSTAGGPNELSVDFSYPLPQRKGLGRLHISHLLQLVLQDAQTRLFFKAQSAIQSDVRYYVPKLEDLAYPEKLVVAHKSTSELEIREKESINQIFRLSSVDKQETWFPTVQKTIWILSQLHDFINPAIFEDIAQEALNLCRQSLISAAELIKGKSAPSSKLDGHLFLVRHLLILKEIAHSLDLTQHSERHTTDHGGVTDTLASLLNKTTLLLPTALFTTFGIPKGEDSTKQVKHGIDHDLRDACEAAISYCTESICEPLLTWVDRTHTQGRVLASNKLAQDQTSQVAIPMPEWAQQSAVEELDRNFREACNRELKANFIKLRLYLEDDRTVGILADHVKDRIVDEYTAFADIVQGMFDRHLVMESTALKEMLKGICSDTSK